MNIKQALGKSLQKIRKQKGLTQEDFSVVSSRTYMSVLERGQKSPTVEKLEVIAKTLGVHPLSILLLAYSYQEPSNSPAALVRDILEEVKEFDDNRES